MSGKKIGPTVEEALNRYNSNLRVSGKKRSPSVEGVTRKTVSVPFRLNEQDKRKLDKYLEKNDIGQSQWLRHIIRELKI